MAQNYKIEQISNGWTAHTEFPGLNDGHPMPMTFAPTLDRLVDLILCHEDPRREPRGYGIREQMMRDLGES